MPKTKTKTKTKTIAQRISELEHLVAGFFSGATKTSKARVKRSVKRAKAGGSKRATQAKRAVKRTAKTARRKAASVL
jgi:hypothetical protein